MRSLKHVHDDNLHESVHIDNVLYRYRYVMSMFSKFGVNAMLYKWMLTFILHSVTVTDFQGHKNV